MYEIGHGIEVYFKNQKDFRNTVFFSDGRYTYYDDGGMLFETISDEAMYLLSDKVENMLRIFPDAQEPVSADSITSGFKWLYGTIDDEERPVVTELFRSCFNESIQKTVSEMASRSDHDGIGDFLQACYEDFSDHVRTFCVFVQAIDADASGIADDFQKDVARAFYAHADDMYETYTKKCSVRKNDGHVNVETHQISNFLQLLVFEYCRIKKGRKAIKECANCGRLFIPTGRVDTIYCHCPAPGYPDKTCSDVGAHIRRTAKRRSDPKEREHHNKSCNLHNMVRRAKENGDSDDMILYYEKKLFDEMKRYVGEKADNES